jgi:hypothetical protein
MTQRLVASILDFGGTPSMCIVVHVQHWIPRSDRTGKP